MGNHSERPPRLEIAEQCKIVRENGGRTNGKLINLSDEGFCVESRYFFHLASELKFTWPVLAGYPASSGGVMVGALAG